MNCSIETMLDPSIKKLKSDLEKADDQVILQLYYKAQGDTKDFTKHHNMDFSYSYLITELSSRGYEQKTVFEKDNTIYDKTGPRSCANKEQKSYQISIDMNEETVRKHLTMVESSGQKFAAFLKNKKHPYTHVTAALELYMRLYEEGKLDVYTRH